MPNRLASETSPYLRQHAGNPVDWYPFSQEAFAQAKALDRPILLSVGYSACHWCHVMAHESFEDPAVAEEMNARFVNVKVDREELPDVDQIYQRALQLQGEHGGWPLTIFLTPDGVPFFGGTYFPPDDRYGRPSFRRVLVGLSQAWQKDREGVVAQSQKYAAGLKQVAAHELHRGEEIEASQRASLLDRAIAALGQRIDPVHGGFGKAPKFPNASALRLLLRGARRVRGTPEAQALTQALLLTLRKMAAGGIYDQAGGGFARYSTDERWLVPHFEKMLYDNAQLLSLYAEGWQHERDPLFERAMRGTAAFIERELRAPEGGLYTALDADSEGVEGKFYAWSWAELAAALDEHELEIAEKQLGATREGNWRDPHGHAPPGANVLSLVDTCGDDCEAVLKKLFLTRASRVRPGTDDKVLASVNGLAIAGLAEAGRVLGDAAMIAAARRTAEFVLGRMRDRGGRLLRSWKGEARLPGTLDDHAYVADGLFALYDATGEARWFDEGVALLRIAVALFWDAGEQIFYLTAAEETGVPRLIERPVSGHDGALPAGASMVSERLLVIGEAIDDEGLRRVGEQAVLRRADRALEQPFAYAHLLGALDTLLEGPAQLVLSAPSEELERAIANAFVPGRVIVRSAGAPKLLVALVADKQSGTPAVFVCRGRVCERPATQAAEVTAALTGR
jgi:uncharacterized protein YyaL (SSP411 family)